MGNGSFQRPCTPKAWAYHMHTGPLDCTFIGSLYGGFYLPDRMCFLSDPEARNGSSHPEAVAYGFGVGSDISYDIALASAYPKLRVRLFDPTPGAVTHVHSVFKTIETGIPWNHASAYWNGIATAGVRRGQFSLHPWALGSTNGEMKFRAKRDAATGKLVDSYFSTNSSSSADTHMDFAEVAAPMKTLGSIMRTLEDEVIDILKIDIEGAEVDAVPEMLAMWKTWPRHRWPRVLMIDMDSLRPNHPRYNETGAFTVVHLLQAAGYRVFAHLLMPDYTFVLPLSQREAYPTLYPNWIQTHKHWSKRNKQKQRQSKKMKRAK